MTFPQHNLPTQSTSFVGRKQELAELVAQLDREDCRLLTLVGAGGIGKTRLALEVAARKLEQFHNGAFWVPLAPLQQADGIVNRIINVLGIHIGSDGTPYEQLVRYLSGRKLLLILDNFEHLLDGADLLADFLQAAPDIKLMVTSREVLNLQEEWVWQVQGMAYPLESITMDNIGQYSALQLFLERAQKVQHDFPIEADLTCAIRICQLVEGMPLALELAASWLTTLTCAEIADEIGHNIDFLETHLRNVPPRHRSVRAVFEQSWNLLTETEQRIFRRLSIFRGGFEREAAARVTGASLLTLSALVEKSLLRKLHSGRYDFHILVRQYAEEQLAAAGENDTIAAAHRDYYTDFMQERAIDIKGRDQLAGLNAIEADFENVHLVWDRAVETKHYPTLEAMAECLALFCDMRARYQTGEHLLEYAVIALAPKPGENAHPVWNRLRARRIQVWILAGRPPVPQPIRAALHDTLTLAEQQNDAETVAICQWSLGELNRIDRNCNAGVNAYEEALGRFEALGSDYYVTRALRGLVFCQQYTYSGRVIALNERYLSLAEKLGDQSGVAHGIFLYRTALPRQRGDLEEAAQFYQQARDIWKALGDDKGVAVCLNFLGLFALYAGEFDRAYRLGNEAYTLASNRNYTDGSGASAVLLAIHDYILRNDTTEQRRSDVERYFQSGAYRNWLVPTSWLQALLAICGGDYPAARRHIATLFAVTRTRTGLLEAVVGLPVMAFILAQAGDNTGAAELLGLAYAHPPKISGWMEDWSLLQQLRHDLEATLGPEAFTAAWERGATRDLDPTIADLLDTLTPRTDAGQPVEHGATGALSDREIEVLALLAEGLSNRDIAERLVLSVGTVKVHTRNIYGKLGVSNRTEAAAVARRHHLI